MNRRYPMMLGAGIARGGELVTLRGTPQRDVVLERLLFVSPCVGALISEVRGLEGPACVVGDSFEHEPILRAGRCVEIDVLFPAARQLQWWRLRARFRRWRNGGREHEYSAGLIVRTVNL